MTTDYRTATAGFTLVELMIGIAVVAILLTVVVPSFQHMMERARVRSAAESLVSALQFARSEAIKQNTRVEVAFDGEGTTAWCYGLDDDPSSECDCEEHPADCTIAGETWVFSNAGATASFPGVVVDVFGMSSDETGFAPPRGAATDDGQLVVSGPGGDTIRVRIESMGRVRACSFSGFIGYDPC